MVIDSESYETHLAASVVEHVPERLEQFVDFVAEAECHHTLGSNSFEC